MDVSWDKTSPRENRESRPVNNRGQCPWVGCISKGAPRELTHHSHLYKSFASFSHYSEFCPRSIFNYALSLLLFILASVYKMRVTAITALLAAAVVMAIPSPTLEDEPAKVVVRHAPTYREDRGMNYTDPIIDDFDDTV
ncbi:hypothetical protein CFIMG_007706RA00001 [Ceratocystis fimbriata CBS 114723]|uniref:Uncharacterized protein n=1 Tax=Ceratocystis fimbriata CBS 114723 TaxID=1035309 RepID=A0A2C5WVI1_9PEZI|nr:hypothetical protein CFIMG_007706RA00001 [Ceratocystis fimbriata CBS 114723]